MLVKQAVLFCQRNVKLHNSAHNLQKITSNTPVSPAASSDTSMKRRVLEFPVLNFEWPYKSIEQLSQPRWKLSSTVTCFIVGYWGRAVLTVLNKTKINNLSTINEAIFNRPNGVPLLTVSNHESCVDDPCLIGALMTNKELRQQTKMRWSLGAHDICYKKRWHGWIMSRGKTIPVVRGMGVYQKAIDFSIDRLNEGHWLHIFPEGKVNMEREELHRLKWGIGRIIADLQVVPIVIPFWHVGMQDVLPNFRPYYPRLGKKVLINIGKPIDVSDIFKKVEDKSAIEKRKSITDFIQGEMKKLRLETLELAKNDGMVVKTTQRIL